MDVYRTHNCHIGWSIPIDSIDNCFVEISPDLTISIENLKGNIVDFVLSTVLADDMVEQIFCLKQV